MKNIYAYTDAIGVQYPAYISINESDYVSASNKPFSVSVRDEGGGGTNPSTTQIWMPREQLQKMADDINAYLKPAGAAPEQKRRVLLDEAAKFEKVFALGDMLDVAYIADSLRVSAGEQPKHEALYIAMRATPQEGE
jgi:hypothetical protein